MVACDKRIPLWLFMGASQEHSEPIKLLYVEKLYIWDKNLLLILN